MLVDSIAIVRETAERAGVALFRHTGSIRVAQTPDRVAELRRHAEVGVAAGLDLCFIDAKELARRMPYARAEDVLEACYCSDDGYLEPPELAKAYITVGRQHGVKYLPHHPVEEIMLRGGAVRGVRVAGDEFAAPVVVNAAGPWSYLVAGLADEPLPTAALGHYYLTTKPDPRFPVGEETPGLRDRENRVYSRPKDGGLRVGMYELNPDSYEMADLPSDFSMSSLEISARHPKAQLLMEAAGQRFPFLAEGVEVEFTTGIMSFTPDGDPLCGRLPDVQGLYHCSGFCGHGIAQSGAVGLLMAELILDGKCRYDLQRLRADRFFDLPELYGRPEIETRCYRTYADYYGAVELAEPA